MNFTTNDIDNKIKELINKKSVYQFYKQTYKQYQSNQDQTFLTDFQILITKIGIIISDVLGGPHIDNFKQSLDYLCYDVIIDFKLKNTLSQINTKGNIGKHDIKENKINMDKVVKAYNSMISKISDMYSLPSLKKLYIKRDKKKAKISQLSATQKDNYANLKVNFIEGYGRYETGVLFFKHFKYNFQISVNVTYRRRYKLSSIKAIVKCGDSVIAKRKFDLYNNDKYEEICYEAIDVFPPSPITEYESKESFDIPWKNAAKFGIEVIVELIYKIGRYKRKRLKTKVTKIL